MQHMATHNGQPFLFGRISQTNHYIQYIFPYLLWAPRERIELRGGRGN